jgi:hypothetical protein
VLPEIFNPTDRDNIISVYNRTFSQICLDILSKLEKIQKRNKQDTYKYRTKTICVHCGKYTSSLKKRKYKHGYICLGCFNELFFTCPICEKLCRENDTATVFRNRARYDAYHNDYDDDRKDDDYYFQHVCRDCYKEHTARCRPCGYHGLISTMLGIEHPDRYARHDQPDMKTSYLCSECQPKEKTTCHTCGTDIWRFLSTRNGNRCFCDDCGMAEHGIYDFNAKPKNTAKVWREKLQKHTLLFGVELETELYDFSIREKWMRRDTVAEKCKEIMGKTYVYCKHDGSIGGGGQYGFEVVSQPFSWSDYQTTKPKWEELMSWLRQIGWSSDRKPPNSNGCGLHVHLSKGSFNTFHLYKFLQFMYDENNRPLFNTIARRQPNKYCDYYAADQAGLKGIAKDKINADHMDDRRHAAVSLMYKPTVELRIFKGTLDPHLFSMTIEFCKAAYEFTKITSAKEMNVYSFINYLLAHPTGYENLIVFLHESKTFKLLYKKPYNILKKGM